MRVNPTGKTIHLVMSRKLVHSLGRSGLVAACIGSDTKKFIQANGEALRNAQRAVIWSVSGNPGEEHAEQTARLLHAAGIRDIRLPVLPGHNTGQGIEDWLVARHDKTSDTVADELLDLIGSTSSWRPEGGIVGPLGNDGVVITLLSDVQTISVDWLWQARIPLGMLTILDGDPGLGKSSFALDIAARLTRGLDMPDGTPGPNASGVVILSAEDDIARVIRPRLDAARADVERVAVVAIEDENGLERSPVISAADLKAVEKAIYSVSAKFVVVDPLVAFLPRSVNANRDQDVRLALVDLSRMAERTGAAVLVIRHLNKSAGGSPIYRGGGSIGIVAAARSAMLLGQDPDDSTGTARVLAMVKSNLAALAPAMRLRLVDGPSGNAQQVVWEGTAPHTAEFLLAVGADGRDRSAIEEAEEFLCGVLAAGPTESTEVYRQARSLGISGATLRRASKKLGIKPKHVGQPGGAGQHWLMGMPEPSSAPPIASASPKLPDPDDDEHLRESDDGKPMCGADDAEGIQDDDEEHLRESVSREPVGPAPVHSWVCDSPACQACGGRTLEWPFGRVCTICHKRFMAGADSGLWGTRA